MGNLLFHLQFPAPEPTESYVNLFYQTFFDSIDSFTKTQTNGGMVECTAGCLYLATGTNVNAIARIIREAGALIPPQDWTKLRKLKFRPNIAQPSGSKLIFRAWTGQPQNYKGFGFYVKENKIYGECANASPITQVLLQTIPAGGYSILPRLEAILRPASKVEFYIDDVKLGELTTNLPDGASYANIMLNATLTHGAAYNDQVFISRWICYQEA